MQWHRYASGPVNSDLLSHCLEHHHQPTMATVLDNGTNGPRSQAPSHVAITVPGRVIR